MEVYGGDSLDYQGRHPRLVIAERHRDTPVSASLELGSRGCYFISEI